MVSLQFSLQLGHLVTLMFSVELRNLAAPEFSESLGSLISLLFSVTQGHFASPWISEILIHKLGLKHL